MSSEGREQHPEEPRNFEQLETQDVREYWSHEEDDFTPWLVRQIRAEGISDFEDALEVGPSETRAGKQRSQIICKREADLQNEAAWDEYLDWVFTHGTQFRETFSDRVQAL